MRSKIIQVIAALSLSVLSIFILMELRPASIAEIASIAHKEDPNGARAFHMMKRLDAKTGLIPAGKAWKALQQVIDQKQIQISKAKSSNANWYNIDDHFDVLSITRLAVDLSNPDLMYFCTGEGWYNGDASRGAGVWKSENAGNTWNQLAVTDTSLFYRCLDMGVHPTNGDVYVGTRGESYNSSEGGLYRSQDGGLSWKRILGKGLGAKQNVACDIEFTKEGGVFIGVGMRSATDGIYYSPSGDSGTYVKQTNGFPTVDIERIEIATAASDDSVAFAVAVHADDSVAGFWHTTNQGNEWTQVSFPGGNRKFSNRQGWYDLCIAVDPQNPDVVVAGGLHLWKSTDAGLSWTQITHGKRDSSGYVHVDQHEIRFVSSDTIYFGNDGGIYASYNFTDSLPTIEDRNSDYNVTQYYSAYIHPDAGESMVIGGTQDNGSSMSTGANISDFHRLSGSDGAFCAINYNDPDIMYTATQYRNIYRKKGGGYSNHKNIKNKHLENGDVLFINPFEMDPTDPDLLFMASNKGLWRLNDASTAADSDWVRASSSNTGTITAIGLSSDDAHTAYYGRTSTFGKIFRVDSAHQSADDFVAIDVDPKNKLPTNFQMGAPNIYCSSIFVDPNDGGHLVITYSNYNLASVYECFHCNTDSADWRNVEGDLPDIPVNWATLHPGNSNACYLATDIGVYYTDSLNGTNTKWIFDQSNLPNIRIEMLRYRASDYTMVAATHGRGIYTAMMDSTATNMSLTWTERGPRNVAGRTRSILVDPNDPSGKTLWAASVSGGLWKTDDIFQVPMATGKQETLIETDLEFTAYPNPFRNQIKFSLNEVIDEIRIYNLNGTLVNSIKVNSTSYFWNASEQTAGLYLVKLRSKNEIINKKIMLQ